MVHVFCQVAIELANGHPQIGAARELNFRGEHADNGVALIVQSDAPAGYLRVAVVATQPKTMTQNDDGLATGAVFVREKRAAHLWTNSQHWKEPRIGITRLNALRFAVTRQVETLKICEGAHLREAGVLLPPIEVIARS